MARGLSFFYKPRTPFWLLGGFLILTALMGGGSRGDILSLILLRPLAVIMCMAGALLLTREHLQQFKALFLFAALVFLVFAVALIPLPPEVWARLPGRAIVTEIDKAANLGAVWRPIAMVPGGALNALFSLFVPLAVLILGVQIRREDHFKLLQLFVVVGLISGFLGILQVVSAPDGPLFFYAVTNNGSAVGLFSNRNHAAVYLAAMFPMLTVFATSQLRSMEHYRFRLWMSVAAGTAIIPLIIVTGSRAGVLLGFLGLLSSAALYRKPSIVKPTKRKGSKFNAAYVYAGFAVVGLALLTLLFSRARAFERLFASDRTDEARLQIWAPIADIAWKYFPIGSGPGSFVEVFQIDEPVALLSKTYTNHAHNDWLEVYMTLGAAGMALLFAGVIIWAQAMWRAWRPGKTLNSTLALARLGGIILLFLGLASIGDYPLRVPSMMCLAMMSAIWLADASAAPERQREVS
jgi:O-antigen ligase